LRGDWLFLTQGEVLPLESLFGLASALSSYLVAAMPDPRPVALLLGLLPGSLVGIIVGYATQSAARLEVNSSAPGETGPGIRVWNEHPDHPILPGREEKLAVASPADMQIGARDARTHRSIDELLQRHILPIAARVPHVELDFFDGRHGLRDSIVSLLHLGEVGREQTSACDIAKDELAPKRGDAAAIREPVGYRPPFVVVVDRDGIGGRPSGARSASAGVGIAG
jgi:hypothetical protein